MTHISPGCPARIEYPGNFLHGKIIIVRKYFVDQSRGLGLLAVFEARPSPTDELQEFALPARRLRPI